MILFAVTPVNVPVPFDAVPDIVTDVISPIAVESSATTPDTVIVKSFAGDTPLSSFPKITKV